MLYIFPYISISALCSTQICKNEVPRYCINIWVLRWQWRGRRGFSPRLCFLEFQRSSQPYSARRRAQPAPSMHSKVSVASGAAASISSIRPGKPRLPSPGI